MGAIATLFMVLALFVQGLVITNETATRKIDQLETNTLLQRGLRELGTVVEKAIEIRIQRDLMVIDAVLRRDSVVMKAERNGPAGQNESETLRLAEGRAYLFDSADSLQPNSARLASELELSVLDGLEAVTLAAVSQLVAASKAEGIELKVFAGLKSGEQKQNMLGERRKLLSVVAHNMGWAFDVAVLKDGRMDYGPSEELSRVGAIGRALGLRWGGDFSRYKAWSHFEVPSVKEDLRKLTVNDNWYERCRSKWSMLLSFCFPAESKTSSSAADNAYVRNSR